MVENREITAGTLLAAACQFADAADCYATLRIEGRSDLVLTFLLSRALELALKAVLRKDGATIKHLRKVGHDVKAAYMEVWKVHAPKRFAPTKSRIAALELLGRYSPEQLLVYHGIGVYTLPRAGTLRGMVHEAIRFALDRVRGPGTYTRLARRPPERVLGVTVLSSAAYGNTSRRRTLKRLAVQAEFLLTADEAAPNVEMRRSR